MVPITITGQTRVEQQRASLVAEQRVLLDLHAGEHYKSLVATKRMPRLDELLSPAQADGAQRADAGDAWWRGVLIPIRLMSDFPFSSESKKTSEITDDSA